MTSPEKLRRLLAEKGWTKTGLAARAKLKPRTIAYIVSGQREPGVCSAIRVAAAFQVPTDWLFDDAQDWPPPISHAGQSLKNTGNIELIDELARRRDVILKDIARLTHVIPPQRLANLESLAGLGELRNAEEEAEFVAGLRDIIRTYSAYNMLDYLEPSLVRPPTNEAYYGPSLPDASLYPTLQEAALTVMHKISHIASPGLAKRDVLKSIQSGRVLVAAPSATDSVLPSEMEHPRIGQSTERLSRELASAVAPKIDDKRCPPAHQGRSDSPRPTNADRLPKRPTGRKRRKAESP